MEQKQQYFYNLIDIYYKDIFMPELNYINENFSKELLEKYNKSPKINLWNDCYVIQNDGVHIYNVVGVNSAIKQMKIKDTKTDEVEVISFEDYFEYRLPLKTPVVYYYKGRELTGDVTDANPEATELILFKKGVKNGLAQINLYCGIPNSKYTLFFAQQPLDKSVEHNKMVDVNDILFSVELSMDSKEMLCGYAENNKFYKPYKN